MIGAAGGFDFVRSHREGKPVLAFRSVSGNWAGKSRIGRLEPLYEDEPDLPNFTTIRAKPGYAVGGLLIDAPEFVSAYAVVFYAMNTDGTLDPEDQYTSEWVGIRSKEPEKSLRGDGRRVIGIHGRAGAILNAVGLIYDEI